MIEIKINADVQIIYCEAEIQYSPMFRGRNKSKGKLCGNKALYKINNKHLCERHAQKAALEYFLNLNNLK
ncbi:MAG TPA: hypothetical protein VIY48_00255 [Candidatus Paceibacterota bacterium]